MTNTAKLPVLSDPGFKVKKIEHVFDHGDVSFWALAEDHNDPHRLLYVLVNGLLIMLTSEGGIRQTIAKGSIPDKTSAFVSMLKEEIRKGQSAHKLIWEALDLPIAEWEAKTAEAKRKKEERNTARETFEREQEEKRSRQARETIERTHAIVKKGGGISGEVLLRLAKHFKIAVPPQTAGVLNRTVDISESSAQINGKTKSQAIFGVYRAVRQVT